MQHSRITDSALSKDKDITTSAKFMQDALKRSSENKSICNQLNILTRLTNLRMKKGEKIEVNFSILDNIVSELGLGGAQTACTDTPLLTVVLLASMPTSFSQAVTAISMVSDPLPSNESVRMKLRVFALTSELQARKSSSSTATATVVLASNTTEKNK